MKNLDKFPFRIHTVRTERRHEFQAQFHWHIEDKGIRHVYIKPSSLQLNGKLKDLIELISKSSTSF